MEHTPLEMTTLSPEAQRALGPGPAKMMAARGMAPLANPRDLISVLYQLAIDGDRNIAESARKSAADTPARVLAGGLADESVDPRVLDFFSRLHKGSSELLSLIIRNRTTDDRTIAWIAGKGDEALVELIAENQRRLLRHPEIIGALYTNRQARMSTVDRVVELAAREKVKVPGIAAWDDICRSILQSKSEDADKDPATLDAAFAAAARANAGREGEAAEGEEGEEEATALSIREMTVPMKMRLATLGNSFDRAILIRDSKKMVAVAAIKAPGVTDAEAGKYAGNHALCDEVIAYIASRREWLKPYSVKLALVQNPKTPLPVSMRLMAHLREKDIKILSRSKGVPSALAAQARKLAATRGARK